MRPPRDQRAIAVVVRCYPARWRSRHGEEATLLISALLEDGIPWWSIALNFLGGASRERILRKPSLQVGTTLAAIMIGVAAVPLALFASLAPAGASSTNVVIVISKPDDAARQLESAFSSHHFKITVSERVVPTRLVGSILSANTRGASSATVRIISELRGQCINGATGCIDGLVLPRHFSGNVRVTIGRTAALVNIRGR
jgi:hypothetical protein